MRIENLRIENLQTENLRTEALQAEALQMRNLQTGILGRLKIRTTIPGQECCPDFLCAVIAVNCIFAYCNLLAEHFLFVLY